jgi:hypothetical protein
MFPGRLRTDRSLRVANGSNARSTIAFAAIGDHVRLPARFFARLFASDGSLLRL